MVFNHKKANVLATVLVVAGLLAGMTYLTFSTKDTGFEKPEGLSDLMLTYDDATTLLGEAIEGAVTISIREYSLNGYSKTTPLWVEDLPIPPGDAERKSSLQHYVETSINERLQDLLHAIMGRGSRSLVLIQQFILLI